jgi:hypothetical protein
VFGARIKQGLHMLALSGPAASAPNYAVGFPMEQDRPCIRSASDDYLADGSINLGIAPFTGIPAFLHEIKLLVFWATVECGWLEMQNF